MIPYEKYKESADYLRQRIIKTPETAVVLGSGLGRLADELESVVRIPYIDIPGFPRPTVESHAGMLVSGVFYKKPIIMLSGRSHVYEGYSPESVSFYVRVLHLLGVSKLVLTNAAGGVNESFNVGDFMLITDHIKFFAESPARGHHLPEFGERFFDLSRLYSPRMREIAKRCAENQGIYLREGVYFYMPGPEFETPAEIRAIRTLGGDAVGMSTVFEAVTAAQCGMEVLGMSCITNMAAGIIPDSRVSDEEVTQTAARLSEEFSRLMRAIISQI
ncbi:MAG: purine-nucleoside phosphorylase [Clostridiales bacterium]|jgi:purine-nucleoside phosphorylase|nr:purine-nucleoside phosphorylase [Clostridiales bacterium]